MREVLEELWKMYETAHPTKNEEIDEDILNLLDETEEKLLATLTAEQAEWLETIKNCFAKMAGATERAAFIKGVRFATKYTIEAMSK